MLSFVGALQVQRYVDQCVANISRQDSTVKSMKIVMELLKTLPIISTRGSHGIAGYLTLTLTLSVFCMRSKAWLAACVSLPLARWPRALQTVLSAHVAFAPSAWLPQTFSRTLRSQKT